MVAAAVVVVGVVVDLTTIKIQKKIPTVLRMNAGRLRPPNWSPCETFGDKNREQLQKEKQENVEVRCSRMESPRLRLLLLPITCNVMREV